MQDNKIPIIMLYEKESTPIPYRVFTHLTAYINLIKLTFVFVEFF